MYNILTLNKISEEGLKVLEGKCRISDNCENPDAVIVRSASMEEYDFSSKTVAVARAGAGVNNIPVDKCTQRGIIVFNTPGANANAVKELTVAALMLASRKIAEGIAWCNALKDEENLGKLVEKYKSQFSGPEIAGKTLGVVGLGEIGSRVAAAARDLGMNVMGFDTHFADKNKFFRDIVIVESIEEVYRCADYITLHIPCNGETTDMLSSRALSEMKDGVRIINLARGELVNSDALVGALESGKVAAYVTDFPCGALTGVKNVTLLPHLGASTPESEENCARMAANELLEYLESGNIKNSVNFPDVAVESKGERLGIVHYNTLTTVNDILGAFMLNGVETTGFSSKARGEYAYTLIVSESIPQKVVDAVIKCEDVIKVRKI